MPPTCWRPPPTKPFAAGPKRTPSSLPPFGGGSRGPIVEPGMHLQPWPAASLPRPSRRPRSPATSPRPQRFCFALRCQRCAQHRRPAAEVIERGSAVHCISAYEGDIVVMGSDGVFDNVFTDEIAEIVNSVLRPGTPYPAEESVLAFIARRIVEACHAKTVPDVTGALRVGQE